MDKVAIIFFFTLAILILEVSIVFLFGFLKKKRKELWLIVIYTIYTFLNVSLIGAIFIKVSGKSFLHLRIFTIAEGLLLIYYLSLIINSLTAKRGVALSGVLFLVYATFDLFTNKDTDTFDSIPSVIECIIIISFSIYYFYEQLKTPQSLFLYSTPNFWIVVGLIIFFAGNFFIFIYAQNNSDSAEFQNTFGLINAILSFIENILFLIAFIIARKESKSIKSNIVAKTT